VDGVDLVDDHAGQALEIEPRALPGAEQGQLLRRGEQDVGGLHPLPLPPRDSGVAGAALGHDRQAHLKDRRHQVALDVHGEGLQGRNVEGVDTPGGIRGRPFGELDQAREEAGEGLSPAGGGDQQGVAPGARLGHHFQLMAARRPAALFEPGGEARRQQAGGGGGVFSHRFRL
jgi:hypothetical protein